MKTPGLACVALLLASRPGYTQQPPTATPAPALGQTPLVARQVPQRREMAALRLGDDERIVLDGRLDEAVWGRAAPASNFMQQDPDNGQPMTDETRVQIAFDDRFLYVAVSALDSNPPDISAGLGRRDETPPTDSVTLGFDARHDHQTAYNFSTNPSGWQGDFIFYDDTNRDNDYNAVWDVRSQITETGWTAEYRIPFSQLRYRPSQASTFGLAITRTIGRLNETSTWPLLAKSANGYVSSFGELTGLRLDRAPKRLEVVPYVVGQVKTQPGEPGNSLINTPDPDGSVGVDLKYALRPGLTLTTTVNPDFGQVEADPAVVNLSAFETFFAERRPFFVEGGGIFNFSVDCNDGDCSGLFYSRRIGRTPRGQPDVPDGGYSASPAQTTPASCSPSN